MSCRLKMPGATFSCGKRPENIPTATEGCSTTGAWAHWCVGLSQPASLSTVGHQRGVSPAIRFEDVTRQQDLFDDRPFVRVARLFLPVCVQCEQNSRPKRHTPPSPVTLGTSGRVHTTQQATPADRNQSARANAFWTSYWFVGSTHCGPVSWQDGGALYRIPCKMLLCSDSNDSCLLSFHARARSLSSSRALI